MSGLQVLTALSQQVAKISWPQSTAPTSDPVPPKSITLHLPSHEESSKFLEALLMSYKKAFRSDEPVTIHLPQGEIADLT